MLGHPVLAVRDSSDEHHPSTCLSVSYETRNDVPGLGIETVEGEDPVAYRTRS